ncbi:MAG: tRNA glutamyl-Q(34) synthetase GluQRS [Candidatus Methylumidiphilus sp.]
MYRGRFAPSPTGPLHLGSLYTALAGFLEARSRRGEWLLRIDDADTPRVAPGAGDSIRRTLERLGLFWDGPLVFQSRCFDAYHDALQALQRQGLLYRCTCSRKTLSALPRAATGHAPYPGTCRLNGCDPSQPYALRVMAAGATISITDRLQGPQRWNLAEEQGDFIVFRRDGIYAYHLATVVDDARAGVTEVLRGFDLLDSTPPQIHLQRLLGLPTPAYCHVPVIVDRHGVKLSKQNLAAPVDGRDPAAVLLSLLSLLRQAPPAELVDAPVAEILAWAIASWDIAKLSGAAAVAEPEP